MSVCPCCGKEYSDYPALSRKDNKTEICPDCGVAEALTAFCQARQIVTAYSPEADMTFILEDKNNSTIVVGFYYGEPNEAATEQFYGSLTARFE